MSPKEPRITQRGLTVLARLADDPTMEKSGADIAKASRMLSGTLYPILIRFEEAGWLSSRWESGDAATLGRPLRRLYTLTGAGQRAFHAAMADLQPGSVSWT